VSFAIDNEVKDRVRLAINIVDLVSSYVELRRQGRGFVGLCPFHDDRRPSMQVNPDRQSWKCWVCDSGGDAFSFVMQKEGVSFPEALRMLAERAGITIETPKARSSGRPTEDKKLLLEAMQWAVQEFHHCLLEAPEAKQARDYLRDRGISQASIDKFQLGFAPESWSWLVDRGVQKNWKPEVLEAVGLLARGDRGSRYDRFRNRAMFPIYDAQSRPIAVGGRVLPGADKESAKYINCNETRLYHKNRELYGLHLAKEAIRKTRQAVVMEGYTDVIMAVQHGIDNAVACCGTALGENHIRVLQHTCDTVVLLLDGDEAGQRRTADILELFVTAQMDLRILTLPDALDPCDFLLQYGGQELKSLIAGAVDALEYKFHLACQGFDPLLDTHRANTALEDILQTLSRVSHKTLLSSEAVRLRQDQLIARLARQFGIEQTEIRLRLDSLRKQASVRERQRDELRHSRTAVESPLRSDTMPNSFATSTKQNDAPKSVTYKYTELDATECELFEIMAMHPELAPVAIERFPVTSLNSDTAKGLFQTYLDLELTGHALDFNALMSAMEDPSLKSVLVSIEEHSSRKAPHSTMSAVERLHSLCDRLTVIEDKSFRRKQIQSLEKKQFDEETELSVLQDIVQQARARQGLFPPTL
jgi:DNA primase